MNERDTIPPAEKLAQFEEPWDMARVAKLLGIGLEPDATSRQALFVSAIAEGIPAHCNLCGTDATVQDLDEAAIWVTSHGCETKQGKSPDCPTTGTPTSPASASEAAVRYPDTPKTPSEYTGPIPPGTWATEDQDEWIERREAFSNEGEVEP